MTESDDRNETRAFFGPRAATWNERFPDDGAKFAAAVDQLALRPGAIAIDVGCGTGRALPYLARAVAPGGLGFGIDVTPEMCVVAGANGPVILGDAAALPLPSVVCDAVFAAGLLNHLPDPIAGLAEFAHVTRIGGRLALFHPIGRAALARRRGHELDDRDVRDPSNLPDALSKAHWKLVDLDDGPDQYLAVATRL